jgi:predicted nucleic acid-binding protein
LPARHAPEDALAERIKELGGLGFKSFDALHVASAEALGAEALVTCDHRFLATARRHASLLKVRVVSPIDLAREIL